MSDIHELEERGFSGSYLSEIQPAEQATWPSISCEDILDRLNVRAGDTLLNIGCGRNSMLNCAVRRNLPATGLEFSPEVAAFSQRDAPEAVVVVGTLQEIPFGSDAFDLVTCLDLPPLSEAPIRLLREVQRVLKCGGRACLLLPNAHYLKKQFESESQDSHGCNSLARDEWEKMLWSVGLTTGSVRPAWSLDREDENHASHRLRRFRRFCRRRLCAFIPAMFTRQFVFFCCKE